MKALRQAASAAIVIFLFCPAVRAQLGLQSSGGGTYVDSSGYSGIGALSTPGQVGRSDPSNTLGRVGGYSTNTNISTVLDRGLGGGLAGPDRRSGQSRGYVGGVSLGLESGGYSSGFGSHHHVGGGLGLVTGSSSTGFGQGSTLSRSSADAYGSLMSKGKSSSFSLGRAKAGSYSGLASSRASRGSSRRYGRLSSGSTLARDSLNRYQLLGVHSALGQIVTAPPPIPAESSNEAIAESKIQNQKPSDDNSTALKPTQPAYATLEQRQAAKTSRNSAYYIERGNEAMLAKNFQEARSNYGMAHTLEPDSAKIYCNMFMSSVLLDDVYQSTVYLQLAIGKARTLNDLQVDVDKNLPSKEAFLTLVRIYSDRALHSRSAPYQIMYAYLAWLAGDLPAARRAADNAVTLGADAPNVNRFKRMLNGETLDPVISE